MENSNRILNNNYAPGIATYGIDGKTGERGDAGTSVFFTTYNMEYGAENELSDVLVKINQNKVLSSYVDKDLIRKYVVGDIIIDSAGFLYKIYMRNGVFDLQYISKIKIEDSEDFFVRYGNRVLLNEAGLDIFDSGAIAEKGITSDSDYSLRLISSKPSDENGRYEFLSFVSKSYDGNEKYLNIFYDKDREGFCIDSDSNILFDVKSLMVKDEANTNQTFDDYYRVEPYSDPIGLLHREYSKAVYSIQDDKMHILNLEFGKYSNIDMKPDFVKVAVYGRDGFETEYVFDVDKTLDEINFKMPLSLKNSITDGKRLVVSLIKGVEICIKAA